MTRKLSGALLATVLIASFPVIAKDKDVTVTNEVDVHVTNPVLAVEVANAAPVPVQDVGPAESPARGIRYVGNASTSFAAGSFSTTEVITPAIPPGKKLVLQTASIHTLLTDGQAVMEARLSVGSQPIAYVPQVFQAAGSTQGHYTGNVTLDMTVSAGETLTMFLFRNDNLGSSALNFGRIALTGYFVDEGA